MANPIPTSPRRSRRKDARPSELTAAALSLFVERGFSATRLDDVAARAGVSKGTLYLYFDSKEALFKAVIREGVVPAIAEGEALLDAHREDPERLLAEILAGWWRLVGGTSLGGVPKLMICESRNFPEVAQFYFDEVITRGRRLVRTALELGMARGTFRKVDPELHVHLLMSPLMMLALWRHSFVACEPRGLDAQPFVHAHVEQALRGLRADGAGAPSTPVRRTDAGARRQARRAR